VNLWKTTSILEQLEQNYDEIERKINMFDIDENMDILVNFWILSIPTLLLKK
jgi:hypothetical protein